MFTGYDDFEIHVRDSVDGQLELDIDGRPRALNLPVPIPISLDSPFPGWRQVIEGEGQDIAQLGNSLYELVFREIEKQWGGYLAHKRGNRGLRICVSAQSSKLSSALWETLCDPLTPSPKFLALDPRTPIVRAVLIGNSDVTTATYLPILRTPLRVLVMLASPQFQEIDPVTEKKAIEEALQTSIDQKYVEVNYVGFDNPNDANFNKLQRLIASARDPYDVVHIISHGLFDKNEEGLITLVGPTGKPQEVLASRLSAMFTSRSVTLVILQSCQTGAVDSSVQYFSNVAQQLIACGVEAVLAMQGTVDQDVARRFLEKIGRAHV